ncbi:uncharacterized protein LOC106150880 isoform X2 [Lingula anatina]|uniref:Uncharacterized protein LOC106150880 isoform X2 n=1 Tax=Lingula anatina TaxID=7574 RepID=A0A1S3H1J1_LINAN|nr:uncharacterized protein LOC106150880 isoform X2 [Lingula anatina]|eukprot:XP_013379351.1 uncharacterized protein LOC106150880 isoform X2 [Lingula anatina]
MEGKIDWASSDDSRDCSPTFSIQTPNKQPHKQPKEFVKTDFQLTSTQGSISSWSSLSGAQSLNLNENEIQEPLVMDEDPDISDIEENHTSLSQQQESESVDISSGTSILSTQTSDRGPEGAGMRGSEWAKTLKTPQKSSQGSPAQEVIPEDSAKKKQKFTKGGLAQQLCTLQSREKTAIRFWQHQLAAGQIQDISKCANFFVKSMSKECSLYLAECQTCKEEEEEEEEVLVLLSIPIVQRLSIQPKTFIRLHPPWQKMQILHNGTRKDALLCTNRCQRLNYDEVKGQVSNIGEVKRGQRSNIGLDVQGGKSCSSVESSTLARDRLKDEKCVTFGDINQLTNCTSDSLSAHHVTLKYFDRTEKEKNVPVADWVCPCISELKNACHNNCHV